MSRNNTSLPATPGGKPPTGRARRLRQQVRGTPSLTHTGRHSAGSSEWSGHGGDSGFAELWTTSEIWPPAPETSDPGVLTIRRQIEVLMEGKHLREAIGDVFAD
jgi:hypothetical protein